MIQGLYAAASGMMAVEDRQAVIANNIANVMTPGFKRQLAVQEGFYATYFGSAKNTLVFDGEEAPGGGMKLVETFSDFRNGIVSSTGNVFDIALVGPGFVAIGQPEGSTRTGAPEGALFTRNGKFSVGMDGQLVTTDGLTVLSEGGDPIIVAGGNVQINGDGEVLVDGELSGKIQIVEFQNPHALTRQGFTIYFADQATLNRSAPATRTVVKSEAVEMSNVQLPAEMAHMMMALRAYAANQRVISTIDATIGRLIDQVGIPG